MSSPGWWDMDQGWGRRSSLGWVNWGFGCDRGWGTYYGTELEGFLFSEHKAYDNSWGG